MASSEEEPLLGGMFARGVVRVGETVRRPMDANADYVNGLLLGDDHGGVEPGLHVFGPPSGSFVR
jgi:hypothetical protein